jgi:hypothetical protein
MQQAILAIVDQLAFLPFLHNLDRQAQLFRDLVVGNAVEIRNARVDVDHRVDGAEHVLACVLLVIHVGLRQVALIAVGTIHRDFRLVFHPVQPVNTRFHRGPLQQVREPPRGDARHLGSGLGRVGKLPGGYVAQCCLPFWFNGHFESDLLCFQIFSELSLRTKNNLGPRAVLEL